MEWRKIVDNNGSAAAVWWVAFSLAIHINISELRANRVHFEMTVKYTHTSVGLFPDWSSVPEPGTRPVCTHYELCTISLHSYSCLTFHTRTYSPHVLDLCTYTYYKIVWGMSLRLLLYLVHPADTTNENTTNIWKAWMHYIHARDARLCIVILSFYYFTYGVCRRLSKILCIVNFIVIKGSYVFHIIKHV